MAIESGLLPRKQAEKLNDKLLSKNTDSEDEFGMLDDAFLTGYINDSLSKAGVV